MMGNLKKYQLPLKVGDCLDYLRSLQLQIILLELYGQLFPIQWSNSTIPLFQQSHPTVYTDREIEFLKLLNTWFPIEYYEELETIEERYTEIYLYPQNISWWNQTFEELSQVEQFIISLLNWGYEPEKWESVFGFSPTYTAKPEEIDWKKLERLCQTEKPPLQYFSNVISIIDHSSDCIWLDLTDESYESLAWSKENIIYLKSQWEKALELQQQMAEFSVWFEAKVEHKKATFKLWNQAKK